MLSCYLFWQILQQNIETYVLGLYYIYYLYYLLVHTLL